MTPQQNSSRKSKCKPPAVYPKPTRSSDSSSGSREEQRNTFRADDATETSSAPSEYMPMSEVTLHLKSSQSEPVVQNISIQEGGDGYMSPSEVIAAGEFR